MPTVQICTSRGVSKKCYECCYNFRQVVQNALNVVTICDGRTKCVKRYYIFWHDKLSQNVTSVVIISDRYYKKQNCHYIFAIDALLQKATSVITIYYRYFKMQRLVIIFCDWCLQVAKGSKCYYDLRKGLEHSSGTT